MSLLNINFDFEVTQGAKSLKRANFILPGLFFLLPFAIVVTTFKG